MTLGTRRRQRLTLAVACMAQGMMVLDVLIVSVALPAMQHELHLSPAGLEWVVSGYALALAALIPTGGALGDHFGRKRIFVAESPCSRWPQSAARCRFPAPCWSASG